MYGVPTDLDLRALHGARLDQLCLGPFQLEFHFSSGHAISVEGSWRVSGATGVTIDESHGRVGGRPGNESHAGWRVRDLLSDVVRSIRVDAPQSFTLEFASGRLLTIFDDSEEYESFSIQPGDIFV
jgi:hypothetical protein